MLTIGPGSGDHSLKMPMLSRWASAKPKSADFSKLYGDIVHTGITRLNIQGVLAKGIDSTVRQVLTRLESRALGRVWLHVDFDVLDQTVMPAVDSPGSPGLDYQQLSLLIGAYATRARIVGADFTIYDPERSPRRIFQTPGRLHCAGNPQPPICR